MIGKVILASGPQDLQIDLIPSSENGLAIIRKWKDDVHSPAIIAPIPGTDAWMCVCRPSQMDHPSFPRGHVSEALEKQIARLPDLAEQFVAGSGNPDPVTLSLARFLGFITDEQVEIVRERKEQERKNKDDEQDRRTREREERGRLEAERQAADLDASYHGFLRGKTPLQVSKIQDALETTMRFDGVPMSRKEMVEQEVAKGRKVLPHHTFKRIFIDPSTDSFYYQKDLTKTALDYAVFLGA